MGLSMAGASVLGAGMAATASTIGNAINYAANERNNKLQLQLAREADARNLRLWQLTNAYNSPLEQRKRLVEAGLNPGLMYGSLDNTAGLPADSNIPTTTPSQLGDMSGAFGALGEAIDPTTRQIREQQLRSITLDNDNKDPSNPDSEVSVNKENTRANTAFTKQKEKQVIQDMRLALRSNKREQEMHEAKLKELADKHANDSIDYERKKYEFDEYQSNRKFRDAVAAAEVVIKQQQIQLNANELREQAIQYATIEQENYELAQFQFFKDRIYQQIVTSSNEEKAKHFLKSLLPWTAGHAVDAIKWHKFSGLSAEEMWYDYFTPEMRTNLVNGELHNLPFHKNPNGRGKYKNVYRNFEEYYLDAKESAQYQNLAYRKYNTNSLGKATNKAFQTKATVKAGPVSFSF